MKKKTQQPENKELARPAQEYWQNLKAEDVPQMSAQEKKQRDEQQARIEGLYPSFTRKKLKLDELVPASVNWNFFPQQNDGVLEELMQNIVAYGQLTPAIVWQQEDGKYMILGGNTRFEALKKLREIFADDSDAEQRSRFDTMDCNVYAFHELNEIEARKIIIFDNVIRRENTTAVKARSVITMMQLESSTRKTRRPDTRRTRALENVAAALGENPNTVKKLYQLRNLIPEFWPLVDAKDKENKITNQTARIIALLPPELQQHIYNSRLYQGAKLTPAQKTLLKEACTAEEIDEIFSMPPSYTVKARLELDKKPPENYVPLMLLCPDDEYQHIRKIIEKSICADKKVSQEAKDTLMKIFSMETNQ